MPKVVVTIDFKYLKKLVILIAADFFFLKTNVCQSRKYTV